MKTVFEMRTPLRKSHGKITFVLYNKPYPCGGRCLYCFRTKGYTKSTTSNEDTLLAHRVLWNGRKQLETRFKNYGLKKGSGIKCDLAVKGDSFAAHNENYLREYTKELYDFLNDCESENLRQAALLQSSAKDKCVSYKIETRPDQIDEKKCLFFAELGVTTVELGVQSLDNGVLLYNERGHDVTAVENATKLLRKFGFEVVYQMMVGLPGSNQDIDKKIFTELLWKDEYSPDAIKIYPCLLLKEDYVIQKKLHRIYNDKIWKPVNTKEYIDFLMECYPKIPHYVHINRIQRIIPEIKIEDGVADEIDRKIFSSVSNCLWQRSIANRMENIDANFENYSVINYLQGNNRFCFEAVFPENILLGYARLDIVSEQSAIIRDIRVLGNMLLAGEKNKNKTGCQHIGIGSSILESIETKAKEQGIEHIFVKPAFGVVEWFGKKGFSRLNDYCMSKLLKP